MARPKGSAARERARRRAAAQRKTAVPDGAAEVPVDAPPLRHDLATRWFGPTDYDIPRFSFTSGAVVCFALVLALFVVPPLFSAILSAWRTPAAIVGGLLVGFSVAVMEFFHDGDQGPTPAFWMVGSLLTVVVSSLLLVIFTGTA